MSPVFFSHFSYRPLSFYLDPGLSFQPSSYEGDGSVLKNPPANHPVSASVTPGAHPGQASNTAVPR